MQMIWLLNGITFLSAFLLFQIELIVSKIMLPDFGGSYLVWGACVVFFQAVLFLGYFFSFLVIKKYGVRLVSKFYYLLFLLPLLCFPGRSFPQISAVNLSLPLVLNVFGYLLISIGAVFFALSTTSVVLQSWLAGSDLPQKNNPYALFALSNLGSFAALLSYPFLFELLFDLDQQLFLWRLMYLLLLGLLGWAVFKIKVQAAPGQTTQAPAAPVGWIDRARWLAFSAAGVVMFLSVTNILTYEIAPIPLLWVVPLCIYLISFVLNFKPKSWMPGWINAKFYLIFGWSVLLFFIALKRMLPIVIEFSAACWFLFCLCMFCQHHLYKSRPADPANLPLFYLMVSLGGFLGGIFTTWVMPLISFGAAEYLVGLALIALGLAIGSQKQRLGLANALLVACVCITLKFWPIFFKDYNVFGLIILLWIYKICYQRIAQFPRALLLSILLILAVEPIVYPLWTKYVYVYRHRNYYGVYSVTEFKGKYLLMHGTTTHGVQYMDPEKKDLPLAYYHKSTPVGEILSRPQKRQGLGIIGLGSGGLSIYAQEGENIDYFEIDPDMRYIARNYFTFLKDTKGKVEFIMGDARVKIKETPHKYDVLVVDAFSGDAIPVHLLTTEAIEEYRRHLTEKGIILFHISNRYLDFIPVLAANANYLDAYSCTKSNRQDYKEDVYATTWYAMTWNRQEYRELMAKLKWKQYVPAIYRMLRPWTDKYSAMLLIIDLRGMFNTLRYFEPFYW